MVKEITKKELTKIRKRLLLGIKTDAGIERNDKLMERLEDSFHINLTTYYGEENPKRINQLIRRLKKR